MEIMEQMDKKDKQEEEAQEEHMVDGIVVQVLGLVQEEEVHLILEEVAQEV